MCTHIVSSYYTPCVCSVTQLCPTLHDPCQASLSMEFSRQEYWSGLPFPSPEDLPRIPLSGIGPGIKPASLCLLHWQVNYLPLHHLGIPIIHLKLIQCYILTISLKLGMKCDVDKVSLYYYSTFFSTTTFHSPECLIFSKLPKFSGSASSSLNVTCSQLIFTPFAIFD